MEILKHNQAGRYSDYKLFVYDVTEGRSTCAFYQELLVALETSVFLHSFDSNPSDEDIDDYYDRLALDIVTNPKITEFQLQNFDAVKDTLFRGINLKENNRSREFLAAQQNILLIIANGDWRRNILPDEKEKVYIASFGSSESDTLMWLAYSVKEGRYFRLHAWARSILGDMLQAVRGQERVRGVGAFLLSWLLDYYRVRLLYTDPMPLTKKVLRNLDGYTKIDKVKKKELSFTLEPRKLFVTTTMVNYYKTPQNNIEGRCFLCGSIKANFYTHTLGKSIGICGEKCTSQSF